MNRLCQAVLTAALFSCAGCYEMHGLPSAPLPRDAGPIFPDAGPFAPDVDIRDASVPLDGGEGTCPLVRADATCMSSFGIVTGRDFELPFELDGCGCCVETSCDVAVDRGGRTIRLGTHMCPDVCDCDACIVPRGTCAVPAMAEADVGQWTVEVNGTAAFVIGVSSPADPSEEPAPPGCATYAEVDGCGAVPDMTTGPIRGDVCVEHGSFADRDVLRMRSACWGCGQIDSACDAILLPRLTDDLPSGGDIRLHARDYATACELDCPAACEEHVRECHLPPLTPGDFYRVIVDGEVVHSFVAGEPAEPCVVR